MLNLHVSFGVNEHNIMNVKQYETDVSHKILKYVFQNPKKNEAGSNIGALSDNLTCLTDNTRGSGKCCWRSRRKNT